MRLQDLVEALPCAAAVHLLPTEMLLEGGEDRPEGVSGADSEDVDAVRDRLRIPSCHEKCNLPKWLCM